MRCNSLIILVALLFGLSGCTVSSLTMTEQETILISHDNNKIEIAGKVVKRNTVNLKPAMIYQSIYEVEEGGYIVYETTDLDQDYRYNYGLARTIKIIFDAKRVTTGFAFNNLSFFQVELKSAATLNVLAHQSNDQYLTFAYGFSTEQFQHMIDTVKAGDAQTKPLNPNAITFRDSDGAIMSQWKAEMLVIDVIFAPVYRMMMR